MAKLEGKVAIITGSANGIGAGSARYFVEQGARVVIADIAQSKGEALAKNLGDQAIFKYTDVTSEADIKALVESAIDNFGRLDIMWNNAGSFGARGSILSMDVEAFDNTLALLLRSTFLGMKHAGAVMAAQGSGVILNTASISANSAGVGPHVYQAAKSAVEQLTRSVALELCEHGIRVNCVSPGGVPTTLITNALGLEASAADELAQGMGSTLPLNRMGKPLDIARAAAFLCCEESEFITGQNLTVDGGEATGKKWSLQGLN